MHSGFGRLILSDFKDLLLRPNRLAERQIARLVEVRIRTDLRQSLNLINIHDLYRTSRLFTLVYNKHLTNETRGPSTAEIARVVPDKLLPKNRLPVP